MKIADFILGELTVIAVFVVEKQEVHVGKSKHINEALEQTKDQERVYSSSSSSSSSLARQPYVGPGLPQKLLPAFLFHCYVPPFLHSQWLNILDRIIFSSK
jgi:hypothetical protein